VLPGGGQEALETLVEAIIRECREELGTLVTVGELLYVRDYIGRHHEFAAVDRDAHQIELMFACSVAENYESMLGSSPDAEQVGVVWLSLAGVSGARLYPAALKRALQDGTHGYLGDVN
jgi:ADP-ribose pyrophosphatase YjhB (NUDIX family)